MAETSYIIIDAKFADKEALAELETILYGLDGGIPRMPGPNEVLHIFMREILIEDPNDPGTYLIYQNSLIEDPNDPGTYLINNPRIQEDPSDQGTYLVMAV